MIIVPLGISSATPTARRHMACVALWREGRIFLFDCGENAQMRMLQAGMKRSKIDYIFISHLDGDHYFGLLGLLSTFQTQKRDKGLTIVGPVGIKKFIETNLELAKIGVDYGLTIKELDETAEFQIVVDEPDFYVEARPLDHNTKEAKKYCAGYRFQEKDKPGKVDAARAGQLGVTEDWQFKQLKAGQDVKLESGEIVRAVDIVGTPRSGHSFAYVTDTRYSDNSVELARNVTLLYHEATFDSYLKDKAEETGHSTAEIAATVAAKAQAQRLMLGHFSARYTNEFTLMKEARMVFPESWIAIELRTVMTDPEHEKGIIKAKVEIQMPQMPGTGRPVRRVSPSGGRGRFGGGGGRGGFDKRRPSGGGRSFGGGGGRPYGGGGDRSYGDRPSYPPRDRSYGDRPSYPPRDRSFGGDRPFVPRDRGFGDRPSFSSDRPQYPPRDRNFGDRPPYNPDRPQYPPRDRSFGDRPYVPRERSFDDRPPRDFGDRPQYPPRERSFGSDRPEYPPRDRSFGDRPFRPRTDDYNRPPRQDDDQDRPITPRNSPDDFTRRI